MNPSAGPADTIDRDLESKVDVRKHVPALLANLGNKIALHVSRLSARKFDLDLTEWRIFNVLGSQGRTSIVRLAKLASNDPGGVSRSVSRLEARGLISRHHDASDRRRSLVDLTEDGKLVSREIVGNALAIEERLLRRLAPTERSELRRLLNTLIEELDQMMEEDQSASSIR